LVVFKKNEVTIQRKKVKTSKKRLDRVLLKKTKMHPMPSFENILAK
jgi:hypothetical protein